MIVDKSLLFSDFPLTASDAVCALMTLEDGRYLLQKRDLIPNIWYPGHWGLFGGAVESGEKRESALIRELEEEIGYVPDGITRFTNFDFDFGFMGQGVLFRTYYEVKIPSSSLQNLVLSEGAEMQALTPAEIFDGRPIVPYDSFALWLHMNRKRLSGHTK